jgi:hypothetical protein
MATDFSPRYVEEARKRLRYTPLWLRIKLSRFIKKWRLLRLRFGNHTPHASVAPCHITPALEAGAEHFQKHGWTLVENILSPEFHAELVAQWPAVYYLEPPRELAKSYNTGFRWISGDAPGFAYSDPYGQYTGLKKMLDYVRSAEFTERVERFVGRPLKLLCYSFILHATYPGTEVLPHRDSIAEDPKATVFLNMLFFINGTGGKNSGGLTLSRDNELRDIIVEPENLTNACLIYDSMGKFYHGFKPVAKGKFRWGIGVEFCEKNYAA